MDTSLFSHAPREPEPANSAEPVECRVTVARHGREAFEGFTDLIHLWWPVDSHSVAGEGSHVEFEDKVLTETSIEDAVHVWGEILDWVPDSHLRLTWHPGRSPATSGELRIDFAEAAPGRTEILLVHSGWENMPDGQQQRADYAEGWPEILGRYIRFMGGPA
jgi:uncharacterized protein YndB with AHSA1/START domain